MKILVTGGAGFIGTHTVRALLARGDEVRVLDALTQPVHEPGAVPRAIDGAEFLAGDVRSAEDWVRALEGVDAVVHLAAYQDYLPDFSTFFTVNAAGTALLYETIVARGLPVRRIVVASSQAVYGEGSVRCAEHGALERGHAFRRLAAERAALALGETYAIPTAALRYSIVHGPGQSPRNAYSGLLRAAALRIRAGKPPLVFEDGGQLRDYVSITDVVSANLIALDHPGAAGRAYNVGGGRAWTVIQVIEALAEIAGVEVGAEMPGTYRVGDVRDVVSDVSLMRSLGWTPSAELPGVWCDYWVWLDELAPPSSIVDSAYERMEREGVLRSARE